MQKNLAYFRDGKRCSSAQLRTSGKGVGKNKTGGVIRCQVVKDMFPYVKEHKRNQEQWLPTEESKRGGLIILSFRIIYHCPHSYRQMLFILIILCGRHSAKHLLTLFKLQAPCREEAFHFFLVWLIIIHTTALTDDMVFFSRACPRFRMNYRNAVTICY